MHKDGFCEHRRFSDIADYMHKGDMLLLNNTKVFPARLIGEKPSGGKVDIVLARRLEGNGAWEALYKGNYSGRITIGEGVEAEVWIEGYPSEGTRSVADKAAVTQGKSGNGRQKKFLRFPALEPSRVMDTLWRIGSMPLPPYIKRLPDDEDKRRYQTVYAEKEGSIAAPTAGLHFTESLLGAIENKGVLVRMITLHVGPGTFKPIVAEALDEHRMDPEYFEMNSSLIDEMRSLRKHGRRLITVGTTTTRAVEGLLSGLFSQCSGAAGTVRGYTDIFICPGYTFKAVDSLVTNFHLPRSTPLMLVSALRGFEKIRAAYEEAVCKGYRFFSYGDAMLIL